MYHTDRMRFVTGGAEYVDDLPDDGAAWLGVVRSDLPHGVIDAIDTTLAAESSGVIAVLTATDLDAVPTIPIRVGPTPVLEGRLQPVLAVERVRYVGEPIAIVVAETPTAAEHAAGLVFAEITPLPAAAIPFSGATVWDDLEEDVLVDLTAADGDVETVLAGAASVIDLDLTTGRKTGIPIEPRGLTARWSDDHLDVWGPTKFIGFTRATLTAMLGVDTESVTIHHVDVGGMFGVRGEFYPEDFLVPWAARRVGRPVRWVERRREHMMSINQAGAQWHRIRVGLDPGGRPVGLDADVVVEAGAYPRPIGSRIAHIVVETLAGPYAWDGFRVRCRTVATHRTPTGTVRGPAAFEATFARERTIDAAARSAGFDPLSVRRAGLLDATAIPYHRPAAPGEHHIVFDSGDPSHVLDTLLESIGYEDLVADRDRRRAEGESVGIGMGLFAIHSALGSEETVVVDLDERGRFLVRTSTTDVGQGLDAMAAAVWADTLGLDQEAVTVWSGDTRAHPGGKGTYSSRSTVFVANALDDAASRMQRAAADRTAELLGCDPDQVDFDGDGPGFGPDRLHWKEVAPLSVTGMFQMERPTYGFGAHIAFVAVDRETGVAHPERLGIAYDCGRAIDPAVVADQIRGAAVSAIGASLYEEVRFAADGTPTTTSLSDYLLPQASGLPSIDVVVCETAPTPMNPLGIKGVGEAGVIGAGAAIANAVADAVGDDSGTLVTRLPIGRPALARMEVPDA